MNLISANDVRSASIFSDYKQDIIQLLASRRPLYIHQQLEARRERLISISNDSNISPSPYIRRYYAHQKLCSELTKVRYKKLLGALVMGILASEEEKPHASYVVNLLARLIISFEKMRVNEAHISALAGHSLHQLLALADTRAPPAT